MRIYNDIKNLDKTLDEPYLNFQPLRYLNRKYDGMVQNILRWSKDKFKFNKIVEKLLAEETRLKVRDQDHTVFYTS